MKVLKGALTETQYHWPCYNPDTKTACATTPDAGHLSTVHTCSHGNKMGAKGLQIKRQTTYGKNEVTYISDRIGLHSVGNASKEKDDYAVSLHLYTVCSPKSAWACMAQNADAHSQPPYAAKYGCHTYNPETGKKSDVKHKQCHFFSEYGVKMED
jgi:cysteine dioxygenase